jgi:hypothetical protein
MPSSNSNFNYITLSTTTVNSAYSSKSLFKSNYTTGADLSDYYKSTTFSSASVVNSNFSVAYWFKTYTFNSAYGWVTRLISTTTGTSTGGLWTGSNKRYGFGDGCTFTITTSTTLTNYNHYACTMSYDASSNRTTAVFYLNGQRLAPSSVSAGGSLGVTINNVAKSASFNGMHYYSAGAPYLTLFSLDTNTGVGYLNEYMAFNRVLSDQDVLDIRNYNYTSALAPSPPIITSITYTGPNFNVYFSPADRATNYLYSINGGSTYTNANTTVSPIIIRNVDYGINYPIVLVGSNLSGNGTPSSTVIGFIPYPCFLQGTKILCMNPETDDEEYIAIEHLRRGDLVKTANHGYKAIELIGHREITNPLSVAPKKGLYWFRKSKVSGLREDLCLTGDHCVLHKSISDEKKDQILEHMGDIYITEDHYRVPACLDERTEPHTDNAPATIWHFALENPNAYFNYGVMANGLLVESSSIYCMYKDSNMQLI